MEIFKIMDEFNVELVTQKCIEWIQNYFNRNGKDCNAIIGISGGKDSTVCAALLSKALGKERVIGVLMPNGLQSDIGDSYKVIDFLGIKSVYFNIGKAYNEILYGVESSIKKSGLSKNTSESTKVNLPPRIRMTTLFAIAQTLNGRVANTCNLSEDWVGYSTLFGDSVGNFSPLGKMTATEVVEIGKYLGLPKELVEKTPSDGLCGKSDEENLGFSYAELDHYINSGEIKNTEKQKLINQKHEMNKFKLEKMEAFDPNIKRTLIW